MGDEIVLSLTLTKKRNVECVWNKDKRYRNMKVLDFQL